MRFWDASAIVPLSSPKNRSTICAPCGSRLSWVRFGGERQWNVYLPSTAGIVDARSRKRTIVERWRSSRNFVQPGSRSSRAITFATKPFESSHVTSFARLMRFSSQRRLLLREQPPSPRISSAWTLGSPRPHARAVVHVRLASRLTLATSHHLSLRYQLFHDKPCTHPRSNFAPRHHGEGYERARF